MPFRSTPFRVSALSALLWVAAPLAAQESIDFDRDIRPILASRCFQCHGPDKAQRQAELRLDMRDSAFEDRGGYAAVVAGDPAASELFQRIVSDDESIRMPPPEARIDLSTAEKERIRQWIAAGAEWEQHWSFVKPQRPMLPQVKRTDWVRNAIDHFVLARLEAAGLEPSAAADKRTLIRRVTLDLTGLPPTPAEVEAFLADETDHAYERVVNRLLESPRYGERMAWDWLDAARYADTDGFQGDPTRSMWPWRDWLVNALNDNMPFDRFTTELLAGDLLPEATAEQILATGFNRNHMYNGEGGRIPEETRVENVFDRTETTATVWLGLTMTCCRCHDHKFDPISQAEYYSLYALFNNTSETGRGGTRGQAPPSRSYLTFDQQAKVAELESEIAAFNVRMTAPMPAVDAAQQEWEQRLAVEIAAFQGNSQPAKLGDWWQIGPVEKGTDEPDEAAIEAFFESIQVAYTRARVTSALSPASTGIHTKWFTLPLGGSSAARGGPPQIHNVKSESLPGCSLSLTSDPPASGRVKGLRGKFRRYQFQNIDATYIMTAAMRRGAEQDSDEQHNPPPPLGDLPKWERRGDYADGKVQQLPDTIGSTWLTRTITVASPRSLELSLGSDDNITVWLNSAKPVLEREVARAAEPDQEKLVLDLHAGTNRLLMKIENTGGIAGFYFRRVSESVGGLSLELADIVATPPDHRTAQQQQQLTQYYRSQYSDSWNDLDRRRTAAEKQRDAIRNSAPTVMIMDELPADQRRTSSILERGIYNKPTDIVVTEGTPAVLHAPADGRVTNRLQLADWIMSPDNPLTARVTVNRYWQLFFGRGLVPTTEDFGQTGTRPTHPELLDWLAVEFRDGGWDVKQLQKTIVMSAAYRQSSSRFDTFGNSQQAIVADPENELYWHAPRYRMPSWMLRDQALAVGGLLNEQRGGPPVRPYQPEGIWAEATFGKIQYQPDSGDKLYRRSLYVFWRRIVGPTVFFDAAKRQTCEVKPTRTNTPLHALTTLNETTFVESARGLAQRLLLADHPDETARLNAAYHLTVSRDCRDKEATILQRRINQLTTYYGDHPEEAAALLSVGESPRDESLDSARHAAWTVVCSTIMNLDEFLTRE